MTGRPISLTGAVRLRATSVPSAFSGETYSVWMPGRGRLARSTSDGRKPDNVLPPPVGAISSAVSPASAAATMANWCGRGDQPRAANQAANCSGSIPLTSDN